MFGYIGLLNMDARDQAFWLRAARRKILFDQLRAIQAVRAGQMTDEGYLQTLDELKEQVLALDGKDTVANNWEELKLKRRG